MLKFLFTLFLIHTVAISIAQSRVRCLYDSPYAYDASTFFVYHEENEQIYNQSYADAMKKKFDALGEEIGLSEYDEVIIYEDVALIRNNGDYFFTNLSAQILFESSFYKVHRVDGSKLWLVGGSEGWGLINPLAQNVYRIALQYESLNNYDGELYGYGNPNLYKAELNGLYGVVDSQNVVKVPFEYSSMFHTSEGTLLVKKGDFYGIIDTANNILTPFIFEELAGFYGYNLSPAKIGKWGLIDKSGKFVVKPEYDDMFIYCGGYLRVRKDGKTGFLDSTGVLIFPLLYDNTDGCFDYNITRVKLNGKLGIADLHGNVLGEIKYDSVEEFDRPYSKIKIGGLYGVMDTTGTEIVPCQYTEIDFGSNYITAKNAEFVDHYSYLGKMISCRE